MKKDKLTDEGEKLLFAIDDIKNRIVCAREGFRGATEDALIDSYIFEIIALNKKYDFLVQQAKTLGVSSFKKIG